VCYIAERERVRLPLRVTLHQALHLTTHVTLISYGH
jgi:hypothetical protein